MDLSKKNIVIDKSKIVSASSIERVLDTPIEYVEPVDSENQGGDSSLREAETTSKQNKIIVISIIGGIGIAVAVLSYLAFRKK